MSNVASNAQINLAVENVVTKENMGLDLPLLRDLVVASLPPLGNNNDTALLALLLEVENRIKQRVDKLSK